MKKPLKIILIILAVLVGLVAALLIWLTATQLNVKTETAVVTHGEDRQLRPGRQRVHPDVERRLRRTG